ncbi:glycosyltransferase, partial [bacterium]|nr:glycosyltransferase [bacterium]
KCDQVIVPTEKIKDLFINKYNITKNINVIPTGIDLTRFKLNDKIIKDVTKLKKKFKLNDNNFIIGSVGRIASEKSFDKLLKNAHALISENSNIFVMLVGDGPELGNLKKLAKELNIEKNVIFTGKVPYDEVPSYFNLFDVMTSFSTTETQGLTILEGLAAKKPTLCINDESFKDTIENNYNGYLFNDDFEFRKYVVTLMHDKKLYDNLSKNAFNSIYKYSKEVFASEVLKVYHKAIEKKK